MLGSAGSSARPPLPRPKPARRTARRPTLVGMTPLQRYIAEEIAADHAFFNDTGPRYAPDAAAQAWRRVLDWYGTYLG